MSNPPCPNGCGELAIDGNRLVCVDCGATPGFVSEPTEEGFRRDLFAILDEIVGSIENPLIIESTPYPGEGGAFRRMFDATDPD